MRKCPDCADENNLESLFCKQCGRCLLAPDPERVQWSIASYTEVPKAPEHIDFFEAPIETIPIVTLLKRRFQLEPSLTTTWLLLLNLLVLILMYEIVRYFLA